MDARTVEQSVQQCACGRRFYTADPVRPYICPVCDAEDNQPADDIREINRYRMGDM